VYSVNECDDGLLGFSHSPTECPAEGPAKLPVTSEACPTKGAAEDPVELSQVWPTVECLECSAGGPASRDRRIRPTQSVQRREKHPSLKRDMQTMKTAQAYQFF